MGDSSIPRSTLLNLNGSENHRYHSLLLIRSFSVVISQLWLNLSLDPSLSVISPWQRQLALWLSAATYYFFMTFLRCSSLFCLTLVKVRKKTGQISYLRATKRSNKNKIFHTTLLSTNELRCFSFRLANPCKMSYAFSLVSSYIKICHLWNLSDPSTPPHPTGYKVLLILSPIILSLFFFPDLRAAIWFNLR